MARVGGITEQEATEDVKELFERQRRTFGEVLNTTPVFALRPTILGWFNRLSRRDRRLGPDRATTEVLGLHQDRLDQRLPLLNRYQRIQGGARERVGGKAGTP